jgi:putative spermidine/putrescine transport system substrate-binding protein
MNFIRFLTILLCSAAAAPVAFAEDKAGKPTLMIGSWPGAHSEAQLKALLRPFEKETGIGVQQAFHDGELRTMETKLGGWDVVDLSEEAATRLCEAGKLEKIDPSSLAAAPGGAPASDDFLPGGLKPCAVANVIWSSVIAVNASSFEKGTPASLRDVFDPARYPGKRAFPKGPEYTLETALLADGVAPSEIYKTLETEEGVDRALAALDRIRDDIVWWSGAREPLRLLSSGDATMALAFNGRVFAATVMEQQNLATVWDGAVYDLDFWAVRAGTPHKEEALKFVTYATATPRMVEQARWFPYAPARKSATAEVGPHAEADVDMRQFAPLIGERLDKGLRRDAAWWAEHRARLTARLDVWRDGKPDPAKIGDDKPAAEDETPAKDADKKGQAAEKGADGDKKEAPSSVKSDEAGARKDEAKEAGSKSPAPDAPKAEPAADGADTVKKDDAARSGDKSPAQAKAEAAAKEERGKPDAAKDADKAPEKATPSAEKPDAAKPDPAAAAR